MKTKTMLLAILAVSLLFSCDSTSVDESIQVEESINLSKTASVNNSYLVISKTNKLPGNIKKAISSANGSITNTLGAVGIVVVKSKDPNFISNASKIKGIQSVVPNFEAQRLDPNSMSKKFVAEDGHLTEPDNDDPLLFLQWGHDAINAPEAWNTGQRGKGVRVAVLDTGFDLQHPDFAGQIDLSSSKDFTGEGLQWKGEGDDDIFSHGSHTAGTIAAADNGVGTIGVAPDATLILVKVLSDSGSGTDGAIFNGILWAVEQKVDIISMSLGITFEKSGSDTPFVYTAREAAAYKNIYNRLITYAYQNGVTVIASAGNDAIDYDHTADLVHFPSDATHAISTSATGPKGWYFDRSTDLDLPAFYTNYGKSTIDFAGPGGNIDFSIYPNGPWFFDMVFSSGGYGDYYFSAGTSMATPHVAGVAALIIGKNGGNMKPSQVISALRASSDDLGKPGNDAYYGAGRVNAYNAVMN